MSAHPTTPSGRDADDPPALEGLPGEALDGGRRLLTLDVAFRSARAEGDTALVEGVAYPALVVGSGGEIEPDDVSRIDTYRTWMAPATLRRFAHRMLERGTGGVDSQHDHETVGCFVESWYQREASTTYPADVWVAVVRVLRAATVQAVLDGTLKGFSIEFTAKYRERVLKVSGKKVRTMEIVDPYPLTLSVVDRPAIRVPFTLVEARSSGHGDDGGGCSCGGSREGAAARREVLVRCAPGGDCTADGADGADDALNEPEEMWLRGVPHPRGGANAADLAGREDKIMSGSKNDIKAEGTDAPAQPPPAAEPAPAAARAEPEKVAEVAEPAVQAEGTDGTDGTDAPASDAGGGDARAARRAAVEDSIVKVRAALRAWLASTPGLDAETAEKRAATVDWTSLASILENYQDKWAFTDAVDRLFMVASSTFWECRYVCADDAELVSKVRTLFADLLAAGNAACDEFDASLGTASRSTDATDATDTPADAAARAGKTISKANMKRLKKAHQCSADCAEELAGMIGENGGDEEEEDATQQNSALRSELATLRAELERATARATVDAEALAEARGQAAAQTEAVGALTAERDATAQQLAAARAALAAAEKRVAALEDARPPAKSEGDVGAPREEKPAERAKDPNPWRGFLFGAEDEPQ